MKDAPDKKARPTLSDLEVPMEEGVGMVNVEGKVVGSGPVKEEPLKDVFNEEEMGLLNELMRKVESTGELDEELNLDLSQFTERVESVVDSIHRIENIERTQMERLLYKEEPAFPQGLGTEVPPAEPVPDRSSSLAGSDDLRTTVVEGEPLGHLVDAGHHIVLTGGEPYAEAKAGGPAHIIEGIAAAYGSDLTTVLSTLRKLIDIKLERSQVEEAKGLLSIAMGIGSGTEAFVHDFADLMHAFGIEVPPVSIPQEPPEEKVEVEPKLDLDNTEEARVLAPELAGEIGSLQKRSRSALNQLRVMMDSTDLSGEEAEKVKGQLDEATTLYRENRFHKAHQVALAALSTIKEKLKDTIDMQLQNDLFQAREVLDELARGDEQYDVMTIEGLREQLDKAMKYYLTNEYERANLLGKSVIMALRDLKEPEGKKVKETAATLSHELDAVREQNQDLDGMEEAERTMSSIEELISKRNYSDCSRLVENLRSMLDELRRKSEDYSKTKEMSIRLTNRMARFSRGDYDLREVEKKLSFLKAYFQEGRYEDALLIGNEIEAHLDSMENMKKEMEAKEIFNELENLMLHVDEMEGSERLKELFGTVRSKYVIGEHGFIKVHGLELLETMRRKTKTLSVERAKRISTSVIESKLLALKLRSMDRDTIEHERAARKARTLMKEGNIIEGLRQLDKVNSTMREELQRSIDFMRNYVSIYRDSLEVMLDRHRSEPLTYYLRNRHVPILRRMEQLGKLNKALDSYRKLEDRFSVVKVPMDKRSEVETNLTDLRFELYKRKDQGMDITEPLSIYNRAQRGFSDGKVVVAEYLTEVTKRYYERFLPI